MTDKEPYDYWKTKDACEECGVSESDAALRAIRMREGRPRLLCRGCFSEALQDRRVDPNDPRLRP